MHFIQLVKNNRTTTNNNYKYFKNTVNIRKNIKITEYDFTHIIG